MNGMIKFVLGSLLGGCCVYVAVTACSSGRSGGVSLADAQTGGCSRYQVVDVYAGDLPASGEQVAGQEVHDVPLGWEPFAEHTEYDTGHLALRRCLP